MPPLQTALIRFFRFTSYIKHMNNIKAITIETEDGEIVHMGTFQFQDLANQLEKEVPDWIEQGKNL